MRLAAFQYTTFCYSILPFIYPIVGDSDSFSPSISAIQNDTLFLVSVFVSSLNRKDAVWLLAQMDYEGIAVRIVYSSLSHHFVVYTFCTSIQGKEHSDFLKKEE